MKELIQKTGLQVVGICKGVNDFVSKKTGATYYSVDIEVKGSKNAINVKLPEGYDRSPFKEYELCKITLMVQKVFNGNGLELVAIKP